MKEKMVVLIVDDEPELREIIALMVAEEGYSVLEASGGYEALELIKQKEIHLVISDMRMPEGSGEDLLRALKDYSQPPPVILVSGDSQLTTEDARKIGAVDLLPKPIDLDVIFTYAQEVYDSL